MSCSASTPPSTAATVTAMAACYAPDAHFRDPVFGDLSGAEAGAMWRMLTRTARDLKVEVPEHDATSAHWIARYTFPATGRPVVNDVHATFRIEHDLIVDHVDRFSFWQWSRQALGPKGLLLGWTPCCAGRPVGTRAARPCGEFIGGEQQAGEWGAVRCSRVARTGARARTEAVLVACRAGAGAPRRPSPDAAGGRWRGRLVRLGDVVEAGDRASWVAPRRVPLQLRAPTGGRLEGLLGRDVQTSAVRRPSALEQLAVGTRR